MRRIICLGNRWAAEDAAGPLVYDRLAGRVLPAGVEVVDGGLAGLDLLRFIEGAQRIVLVDAVRGWSEPGQLVVLDVDEVAALASQGFDHAAGLPYLLRALPYVCQGAIPLIHMIGLEPPVSSEVLTAAADLSLSLLFRDN